MMESRKYGRQARVELPAPIGRVCEVMHFERAGTSHAHSADEIAICVSGSGSIFVGEVRHEVQHPIRAGEALRIPAGSPHYMVPHVDEVLIMLIGYCGEF